MNDNSQEERIWTVSEINLAMKDLVENSFTPFWMTGEAGNLTIHRSGHVYLTLKDEKTQMKTVYFGGAKTFQEFNIREGDKIEAYGSLGVYTARGEYQFNIRRVRLCGTGSLQLRFEELKRRLAAEGLFDSAKKKRLPEMPTKIGVISSVSGAALKDFLKIALRRFPGLHIRVCPAPVQGAGAAEKLAKAVRFFNRTKWPDIIVITRGGGSLEDLWPFNEEVLARAIAASEIPTVSAVGHEIDFTIADFAADFSAPTPSGAAEIAIPEKAVYENKIRLEMDNARKTLRRRCEHDTFRLEKALMSRVFTNAPSLITDRMQYCDSLMKDAQNTLLRTLERDKFRLEKAENSMYAFSPYKVLERGYAILLDDASHKAVTSKDAITHGTKIEAIMKDGRVKLTAD